MPVGLHHLRYFVAVAEEGNVSCVSDLLRIAQPSLCAQIKYRERNVGTLLFHRHNGGAELTRAGALFLADARKSIKAADAAVAAARTASHDEAGTLRVGFIVGTQVEPTSRILGAFRQRYPAATLELTECNFSDPSAGLNGGDADIAFIMPPITHNGLSIREIYHVPRVAVISAGHRLAGRATISVHELFDDPWIVAETSDTVCRDFWLATGHRAGRPPKLGQATKSIDKFIQLAVAGQVVGLAAAWVEDAFARPGIRFVPVIDIEPAVTAIAWRPGCLTPLAERLLTIAADHSAHGAGPAS